nr:valine N-monooxygenase 1-like [Tanacetum cinerariifolium]GEX92306.1 valine N-monooxygenase 1-like [Tanacetum cinerariifolium]
MHSTWTCSKIALEFMRDVNGIFSPRPHCMSGYLTSGGYLTTGLVPMGDHWQKMRRILTTEISSVARHKWLENKRYEVADNLLRDVYNQCKTNVVVTGESLM